MIPGFQSLMLHLLKLAEDGRETSLKEATQAMADKFHLSKEERRQTVPSGRQTTIYGRTSWAITDLVMAGLLERPQRAHFTITDEGRKVLAENPSFIDREFLKKYPSFLEFCTPKPRKRKPKNILQTAEIADEAADEALMPDERIDGALNELHDALKHELLKRVTDAPPEFFEKLVINLLLAMGYGGSQENAGMHTGKSGDEGIDGIINEDKLGLDKIYVQAKRFAPGHTVGRSDLQKFVGSIEGKSKHRKGVFVTTSSFTVGAKEYIEKVQKNVILIDGQRFVCLMIEHDVGVKLHRNIKLKRLDEDFFEEIAT